MALLVWQDDLNIGIDVIDQQHRRIIEMLNHLHVAQASMQRAAVGEVIDEVVDYTMSHFAFEEELMEEAGYPFCAAHKRVHEVFIKRVSEYRMRFQAGEDISDELRTMLALAVQPHPWRRPGVCRTGQGTPEPVRPRTPGRWLAGAHAALLWLSRSARRCRATSAHSVATAVRHR